MNATKTTLILALSATFGLLTKVGEWLAPVGLRLLLAYEFWQSGLEKWHGENWFADIQDRFPFPFNLVSPEISWQLSTWAELIAPRFAVAGPGHALRQCFAYCVDHRGLDQCPCRQRLQRLRQRLPVASDVPGHARAAVAIRSGQAQPGSLDRALISGGVQGLTAIDLLNCNS